MKYIYIIIFYFLFQISNKSIFFLNGEEPNKMINSLEKATFGGGCFWCMEAILENVLGVKNVISGYAGGDTNNPTYKDVCNGKTGHAEVIQIEYNPSQISFEELLDIFWQSHDPTTLNMQGGDIGTQYRSIILTHDEVQMKIAENSKNIWEEKKIFSNKIVTEIKPLLIFYPAEDYHQNYYNNNKSAGYCRIVISPKLKMLKKKNIIQTHD